MGTQSKAFGFGFCSLDASRTRVLREDPICLPGTVTSPIPSIHKAAVVSHKETFGVAYAG
jgi:hypothetical protein